ncbi:hypothetical protein [Vagococcus fluvialis]|uniref:hypothetical protein n=1 Tax=Vagococcus fluvialis TaxID=2738 RepID=UPI003D0ACE26
MIFIPKIISDKLKKCEFNFKRIKNIFKKNTNGKLDIKTVAVIIASNMSLNIVVSILVLFFLWSSNISKEINSLRVLPIICLLIILFWYQKRIIKKYNKNEVDIATILTPLFLLLVPNIVNYFLLNFIDIMMKIFDVKNMEAVNSLIMQIDTYKSSKLSIIVTLLISMIPLFLNYIIEVFSDNSNKNLFYKSQRKLSNGYTDEEEREFLNSLKLSCKKDFKDEKDFYDFFYSFSEELLNIYDISTILRLINYNSEQSNKSINFENHILKKVYTDAITKKKLCPSYLYCEKFEIVFLKIDDKTPVFNAYENKFQMKINKSKDKLS